MKRAANLTELVLGIVSMVGLIIASWVNINSRVSVLETEQKYNQDQMKEIKTDLKEIKEQTTTILLQLQNKEDKR